MFTPKLDWVSQHDERSRNYSIADKVGTVEPKKKYWTSGVVLDQGREGACVGFGWTGEALASPKPFRIDADSANKFALSVYREAQKIDPWPGEDYSGTSVLAGAKVMQAKGYISGYRWAFSMEDLRSAVISEGPVVIGVPWKQGMYETRPSGLVDISGEPIGGHCILLTGYNPRARLKGEKGYLEVYRWRNSWGLNYGVNGNGFIKAEDLAVLLKETGEACVPQGRSKVRF